MTAAEIAEWLIGRGWTVEIEHEAAVRAWRDDKRPRVYRRESGLLGEPYWYIDGKKAARATTD